VIDPVTSFLRAVAVQSPAAPGLAFLVGVVTSTGPCLGSKIACVVGMTIETSWRQRIAIRISFACGLACAFALIVLSASAFFSINAASTWMYIALSATLSWQGIRAIAFARSHDCRALPGLRAIPPSLCRALIAGATYAFVSSPCCTPVLASVAGTAASLRPTYAAAIAAAFGLGHATPVLAGSSLAGRAWESLAGSARDALTVVGGGTMLALGGYYALLA
jgi:cytochrome c biogenesis protein CcdA